MNAFDINGRTPKIGDTVVFSDVWSTNITYLNLATVENIVENEHSTKITFKVQKTGLWNTNTKTNYTITMEYPRLHCNFAILNS